MAGVEEASENTPSALSGCNILTVVGEPFSREHKDLILEQITKGFQSWDIAVNGCDVNTVLGNIASAAPCGDEGEYGDVTIKHSEEGFVVTTLVNPTVNMVKEGLRDLLVKTSKHKHVVYAGHSFQGTGAWILQDDTFSFQNLVQIFRESDVDNSIKKQGGATLSLHCPGEGDWKSQNLSKLDFGKVLSISVNPEHRLADEDSAGINQFASYLGYFVKGRLPDDMMQSSDVVGNIRFSKPTMYIFPGSQGDSALFGVSGFSVLVDGGYQQKPCFWDFARHLDRIDALLLTHLNGDNLFGMSNALNRKRQDNVHPEIGHVFFNTSEKVKHSPNGDLNPESGGSLKASNLLVNLVDRGDQLVENLNNLDLPPQPCTRSISNGQHPVNLYHKVGHGRLDMFVLNPVQDSKELKDFYLQWNKHVSSFTSHNQIPLPNMCSVSALLVWRPASPKEKITRILFPGAAPQSKIFEGLDKIKNLDCLKQPECCDNDFHAKPVSKKAMPKMNRPTPKASVTPVVVVHEKPARSKPSARPEKTTKDVANKKSTSPPKEKKPKDRFERSTTPSPPSRSPIPTPVHSRTPVPEEPEVAPPIAALAPSAAAALEPASEPVIDETPRMASDEIPTPPLASSPEPPAEPVCVEPPAEDLVDQEPFIKDEPMSPEEENAPNAGVGDLLGAFQEPVAVPTEEPQEDLLMEQAPVDIQPDVPVVKAEPLQEPPTEDLLGGGDAECEQQPDSVPQPTEAWPVEAPVPDQHFPEALPDPQEIDPSMLEPAPVVPDYEAEGINEKGYEEEKDVDTAVSDEVVASQASDALEECPTCPPEEVAQEVPAEPEAELDDSGVGQDNLESSLAEAVPSEMSKSQLEELGIFDEAELPAESPENGETKEKLACDEHDDDKSPNAEMAPTKFAEEQLEDVTPVESPCAPECPPAEDTLQSVGVENEINDQEEQYPDMLEDGDMQKSAGSEDLGREIDVSPEDLTETGPLQDEESQEATTQEAVPQSEPLEDLSAVTKQDTPKEIEGDEDLSAVSSRERLDTPSFSLDRPDSSDGFDDMSSLHVEPSQSEPELDRAVDEDVAEAELHPHEEEDEDDLEPEKTDCDVLYGGQAEQPDDDIEGDEKDDEKEEAAYDNQAFDGDETREVPMMFQAGEDAESMRQGPQKDDLSAQPAAVDLLPAEEQNDGDVTPVNDKELAPPDLISNWDDPCEKPVPSHSAPTNPFETEFDPFAPSGQPLQPEVVAESQPAPESFGAPGAQSFDPLRDWGEPSGLPSPPPPADAKEEKGAAKKATARSTATTKKTSSTTTSRTKTTERSRVDGVKKSPSPAKSTSSTTAKSRPSTAPGGTSKTRTSTLNAARNGTVPDKKTDAKDIKKPPMRTRPSTAAADKVSKLAEKKPAPSKTQPRSAPPSRRPMSSATSRSGAAGKTAPSLAPVTPCYVDLTYVPYHADPKYSDLDFFRRIRARYYVVSSLHPSPTVLNNLVEAKQTWEDKDLEVTIIPTYDTDTLRHWMGLHRDQLAELKIDVAPSASRCTIQLQDHETSCSAYRLEF